MPAASPDRADTKVRRRVPAEGSQSSDAGVVYAEVHENEDALDTRPLPKPEPAKQRPAKEGAGWSSGGWIYGLLTPLISMIATLAAALGMSTSPPLTQSQEELLERLKIKCSQKFDIDNPAHEALLRELWAVAYPGKELPALRGKHWKDMGWQGEDPATDLRSAGLMSLQQLVTFGREHDKAFQRLLNKTEGKRSDWEYPFAVGGVNITFSLIDALGILPLALGRSKTTKLVPSAPFLRLLEKDPKAFDVLYAAAFQKLDREWLKAKASYMQFNEIMATTRAAVETALTEKPEPQTMEEVRVRLSR